MQRLLGPASSALTLLLLMFSGGLLLWVGMPLGWLWVGSQVQASTGSVGAALGVMAVGVLVSIAVMVPLIGWLGERHRAIRIARGLDDIGHLAIEIVMVVSATIAVVAFGAWFLLFSGASPIPFTSGY